MKKAFNPRALGLAASFIFIACPYPALGADRYVAVGNAFPAVPYTNWSAAATNIGQALAVAGDGDTIWVTNGLYVQAGMLTVNRAVAIRSVNGAGVTTVRGNGSQRCFLVQTSAVIAGFTITNGVLTGAMADGGGVLATGAATLRDCVLAGNSVSGYGGGAAFEGSGGLVERCSFLDNLATNYAGGGYYGVAGATVRNCLFLRNAASGGGGIWLDHGGLAENCTLVSNRAGAIAGGFVVSHGGEFLNGLCWHNTAPVQPNFTLDSTGGVVRFSSTTPMPSMGTGNITNPPVFAAAGDWRLSWYSPGINAGTNQAWMTGGTDLSGAPRLRGGVVDMGAYETPAIYHVSTNGPHIAPFDTWAKAATNIQSAVNLAGDGETVLVTNGTYVLNTQISIGSGITLRGVNGREATILDGDRKTPCLYLNHVGAVVEGFAITRGANLDYSWDVAGGVLLNGGGTVRNCLIASNTTESVHSGGGANLLGGGLMENCLISGNIASNNNSGGGVCLSGNALLRNSTISGNTALDCYNGGGAYLDFGGEVRNCLIVSNTASDGMSGGGVYYNGNGTVRNCTITANTAVGSKQAGGALFFSSVASSFYLENTIVYSNGSPNYFIDGTPNLLYVDHCCTVPALGTFCITNDPLFANAAAGNYWLTAASPCWNAGTNLAWMTGATDIEGYPRIVHGTADIGAYELSLYHYASQSGSNAWPYLTLAAGATNIQDAIDASAAGDTIFVNDGVYRPGAQLVIPPGRDITLCRYNPSGTVVLDGQNAHRVLLATNCAPQLSGFIVQNGFKHTAAIGGGFWLGPGASAKDCTFTSNYAFNGGGIGGLAGFSVSNCVFNANTSYLGGAVYSGMVNPTAATVLVDCRFEGNRSEGGAGAVYLSSGQVDRCVFLNNRAHGQGGGLFLDFGCVRNSLFAGNRADSSMIAAGGGAFVFGDIYSWGRMENCTLTDNHAPNGSGGGGAVAVASNCIVYGNQALSDNNLTTSLFKYGAFNNTTPAVGSNCITNPPLFADAANGDYRLSAASPCVNAGTNLAGQSTGTDLDGVPRIVDGTVDIGAYERTPRHYVHVGGKAVWPYISAGVGAHDIQTAVDAAAADDTVYIAAGGYTQGVEIVVNKRLAIVGTGGRDATLVTGGASNRCFAVTTNATLDSLTLIGGAAGVGGGLYLSGGGTARLCRVTGCTGTLGGGGVYVGPGGGLVDRCELDGNRTLTFDGAGAYLSSGGTILNSVVRNNQSAQNGGGLFFDHGGLAENCTVVSNTAADSGGGADFWGGGAAQNSIFYFNAAANSANVRFNGGGALTNCCTTPLTGPGGVTGDPLFATPASANYRLTAGSPCIDAGRKGPAIDFDGVPRPLDGNRDGDLDWDIGAFEFLNPLADSDGDGMPDGWENQHFGSPLSGADPSADPDGDGDPNGHEAIADTNPFDAGSLLRIVSLSDQIEFWVVQFPSSSNRVYTLQSTTNLLDAGAWIPSGSPRRRGSGGLMSMKEESRTNRVIDRVVVELPP